MKTCYYKVAVQTLYRKPGQEKLDNNFLCTVCHPLSYIALFVIYFVLLCQKRCLLSCGQYLDVKEVEILSVLKDINKGIITGFGMKTVEHKNDFHVRF